MLNCAQVRAPQGPSKPLKRAHRRYLASLYLVFLLSTITLSISTITHPRLHCTLYALRSTASKTTTMAQYTLPPLPYAYDVSPSHLIVYSIVN